MTRVCTGVFSLTPPAPPDDDGSYLRWHLLDHMPEQFQLPGIQHAMRYVADGDYPNYRHVADGALTDVGNLVTYLVGEPVEATLGEFLALGARLRVAGRFPQSRPSLRLSALAVVECAAAPAAMVSAEVLPWRPHRGVYVVVEEPGNDVPIDAELLAVPGVAGVWRYGAEAAGNLAAPWHVEPQEMLVIYLDADPLSVAPAIDPLVERRWASGEVRPVFAGPLRSMVSWEVWPP